MINYLHELLPQVKKLFYFSDGCGGQYKNYKNFMNLCLHKQDFGLDAEWIFFATCDGIGGSVKHQAAKRSLQRPMNNQILDYQAMLNVCKEEMSKIKFFGTSKETMDEICKSLEAQFSWGNIVPGTWSRHHFIPLSSSKIAHKLSSENESLARTYDLNLLTTFQLFDIRPMTYVTCHYNSFWWVGLVTQVDVEQDGIKVQFMFPHGPHKTFNWPETEDSCYVPIKNILCQISSSTTTTGRTYKITDEEYDKTISACQYLNMGK